MSRFICCSTGSITELLTHAKAAPAKSASVRERCIAAIMKAAMAEVDRKRPLLLRRGAHKKEYYCPACRERRRLRHLAA